MKPSWMLRPAASMARRDAGCAPRMTTQVQRRGLSTQVQRRGLSSTPMDMLRQRSAKSGGQQQSALVRLGAAVGIILVVSESERILTRTYLRFSLQRWPWQLQQTAQQSEELLEAGQTVEAERPWRDALRNLTSTLGEADWETVEAKVALAEVLLLQGGEEKLAEAETLLQPKLLQRRNSRAFHEQEKQVDLRLTEKRVELLVQQGRLDEAVAVARDCLEASCAEFGEFHARTRRAKELSKETEALHAAAPRRAAPEGEPPQVGHAVVVS